MRIILTSVLVLISLSLSFAVGGCESTAENSANVLIKTDRTSYHLDDTIHVDVTSLSGSTVYYRCKGQFRLQLMRGESVGAEWEVRTVDTCSQKLPIYLGETASFALLPEEIERGGSSPEFVSGGEYRLLLDLYEDPDGTILLREESDRLSNRITITR